MAIEEDIQVAIVNALQNSTEIMAVVKGVYDRRPQTADTGSEDLYPCIVIGAVIISEDDTKSSRGHQSLVRLHTWSRSGSLLQCKQIQGLIYNALHLQSIAIANHDLSLLRREDTEADFDEEDIHGICEYRAITEEI